MNVAVVDRANHVADIDLVMGERQLLFLRSDVTQIDLDMRVGLAETQHRARHQFRGSEGHVGDAQRAGLAFSDQAGRFHRTRIVEQQACILFVEGVGTRFAFPDTLSSNEARTSVCPLNKITDSIAIDLAATISSAPS